MFIGDMKKRNGDTKKQIVWLASSASLLLDKNALRTPTSFNTPDVLASALAYGCVNIEIIPGSAC